ncbi:MAG: ABC transporter substrate-binding protein [Janthinobacterium lividum]
MLLGMLAVAPRLATAQDQSPVKIGMVLAKQGVFAEIGRDSARGAMMAVVESGSKVDGRPVQLIWYDDPDPQTAQQNTSKLIDSEKVVAIIGGLNSASALAEASVVKREKIPLVVIAGATAAITGKSCNRYTFRTYPSVAVTSRAIVPGLMTNGKRWYFLAPNYAAGQEAYAGMRSQFDKLGGTEVGYDKLPLGTNDFSSFILKIRETHPDVVAYALTGLDIDNFLKQWAQYGMKGKVPVGNPFVSESSLWPLDKDALTGTTAMVWQYSDPKNSLAEKTFTASYRKKYDVPPSLNAWAGWKSMHAILDAIGAGKSTDAASIVRQLETIKWQDHGFPSYYRSWDHQFVHPLLIVEARAPKTDKWDVVEIRQTLPAAGGDVDALFGSRAEVGCHMDEL